jgi:hypothetical protein
MEGEHRCSGWDRRRTDLGVADAGVPVRERVLEASEQSAERLVQRHRGRQFAAIGEHFRARADAGVSRTHQKLTIWYGLPQRDRNDRHPARCDELHRPGLQIDLAAQTD